MLGTVIDCIPAFITLGSGFRKEPAAWHCDQAQTEITNARKWRWRIAGDQITKPIRASTLRHEGPNTKRHLIGASAR